MVPQTPTIDLYRDKTDAYASMARKRTQQSVSQEAELEDRRDLLRKARLGDRHAQSELMALYGVRLYSETERKKIKVEASSGAGKTKNRAHQRRHVSR